MFEDLTISDEDDGGAPIGPALMPGGRVGLNELLVLEQMTRFGARDFPGAGDIVFTAVTRDGEEIFDPPQPPDHRDEGERWQAIMTWPTVPTVAEAIAFAVNARRGLLAAWWDRLAAARAADEAERPGSSAPKRGPG
jgi:hypothetical protein